MIMSTLKYVGCHEVSVVTYNVK